MALIAPTRILTQAERAGDTVTTLCAICYHVLKRTQHALDADPDMLARINWFTEADYGGQVRVTHLLQTLRDDLGWAALRAQVVRPLDGLKVAPYYGCLLLRPADEIGLDDPERPRILHDCVAALGAEPVDFPYAVECCGSYLAVEQAAVPDKLSRDIVRAAQAHGADLLVTACPLCQFNLDYPQREAASGAIPVVYFTQLMAAALGLPPDDWGLDGLYVDPEPVLARVLSAQAPTAAEEARP
jgi:heterodisulfide reductase subunit B